jgi:hypothetical protein
MVIYETDDSGFADTAIDALEHANIACFRTGGPLPGGSSFTICVHIRNDSDATRANEILIRHGAAIERPIALTPKLVAAIVVGLVLVGILVFLQK